MESSFTWFESVSNEWGALRGGVVREKCEGLWERDYVLSSSVRKLNEEQRNL